MCNCKLCISNRQINARINGMMPEVRPFVHGLLDRALEAENDLAYYEAVLQGQWPGAREILQEALAKMDK